MNTEKINEVVNKLPISLLMVLFLGVLAVDYYNFTSDGASPAITKQQEVNNARTQTTKLETKIKGLNLFVKTLDVKRTEIRALAQELDTTKGSLPEKLDIPGVMKMVLTEGKKVGLNIISLKPVQASDKEYYTEQPFQLHYNGVFPQVLVFLERLSSASQIIRVENITMKGKDPRAEFVSISGTMDVRLYKYLGTNADKVGSKVSTKKPDAVTK